MHSQPIVSLVPAFAALKAGAAQSLDVLVRASQPELPSATPKRPTLNLALVIDTSGSMAGQPLEQAKQAAIHLVRTLQAGDRACVVAYHSTAHLVCEPVDVVAGQAQLIASIERLVSQGSTALRAGWLAGAHAIAPFVSQHGLSRVLLLSDGCATDGSQPQALGAEAAELAAAGISTSTYGLGMHFNEDLMTALASEGQGQAFYAQTAEALIPYFETEFTMLAATVGKRVQVVIEAFHGEAPVPVQRLDTLSPVSGPLAMSPLIAGADSWIAVRVAVPESEAGQDLHLRATVSWIDLAGQAQRISVVQPVGIRTRARAHKDAFAQERFKEVEAARLQREALAKARQGDWAGAEHLVRSVNAMSMGNAYVSSVAGNLGTMLENRDLGGLSKEVAYASLSMASRVVAADEDVSRMDQDKFGLRKAEQGKAASAAPGSGV